MSSAKRAFKIIINCSRGLPNAWLMLHQYTAANCVSDSMSFPLTCCTPRSSPLLHNDTTALEFWEISESDTLVAKLFRRERGHQRISSGAASLVRRVDVVVYVSNCMGGVEVRLQPGAISEADL